MGMPCRALSDTEADPIRSRGLGRARLAGKVTFRIGTGMNVRRNAIAPGRERQRPTRHFGETNPGDVKQALAAS
jgi:hypothetical protein